MDLMKALTSQYMKEELPQKQLLMGLMHSQ